MSKHTKEENTKKKRGYLALLILLLLLLISSCSVTIWSVFFRDDTPAIAPDYAPEQSDPNAIPEKDPNADKLQSEGGGSGSIAVEYTGGAIVDLSDGVAYISYKNPSESNQAVIVQLRVKGVTIAQSGRLDPGYRLKKINLLGNAELSVGTYDAFYHILAYDETTGEKAMVETKLEVAVQVQE